MLKKCTDRNQAHISPGAPSARAGRLEAGRSVVGLGSAQLCLECSFLLGDLRGHVNARGVELGGEFVVGDG